MRKEEVILTAQTIKLSENLNKLNKMHIETDEMILDIDEQIDEMSKLLKNIEGNIDFENLNFNFELNNLQEIKTPINLEELISEEEKTEIKEKIEKKYSNLTSFDEIYYDDFEKLFENSKSYLGVPSGKRGITTLRIFLTIDAPFIFNVFRPFFIQKFSQVI